MIYEPHKIQNYLTPDQKVLVQNAQFISSIVGCVGALFIILTYLSFKGARSFETSIVFFLACADLITGIATSEIWIYVNGTPIGCKIQGALLQFGYCSTVMWSFCIIFAVFSVLYLDRIETARKWTRYYFFLAWVYPLVAAIVPYKEYDRYFLDLSETWCWLPDLTSTYRNFVYIPACICFAASLLLYIFVAYKYFKQKQHWDAQSRRIVRNMGFYILAYFVTQAPAVANRINTIFQPETVIFILYFLQCSLQPLCGFLDGVVYGLTEPMFLEQYKKCFFCRRIRQYRSRAYERINTEEDDINFGNHDSSHDTSKFLRENINYDLVEDGSPDSSTALIN